MLRATPLLTIALLAAAPGCRHDDGLGRVEVRGKVTYQGAPVERGLITFHPTGGSKGPSAGTGIVNGSFDIPSDKGPIVGPQKVEVKIVNAENDSASAPDSALTKRRPGQLKTFSQQVNLTRGLNEFEFSFPLKPPALEKSGQP
jgi:hypothetical protein